MPSGPHIHPALTALSKRHGAQIKPMAFNGRFLVPVTVREIGGKGTARDIRANLISDNTFGTQPPSLELWINESGHKNGLNFHDVEQFDHNAKKLQMMTRSRKGGEAREGSERFWEITG